jgi:hypothetical protein
MADAYHHAVSSARRWGGRPEDYLAIHQFMDSTKIAWCDQRHRAVLHSAFGIGVVLRVFGQAIQVGGREVPVRWIGERHVLEDCGFVPTLADWLGKLPLEPWMARGARPFARTVDLGAFAPADGNEAARAGDGL